MSQEHRNRIKAIREIVRQHRQCDEQAELRARLKSYANGGPVEKTVKRKTPRAEAPEVSVPVISSPRFAGRAVQFPSLECERTRILPEP